MLSCSQVAAFAPRPEEPNAWILARVVREKSNGRVRDVNLRLLMLVVVLVLVVVVVVNVLVLVVLAVLFNQGFTGVKRTMYRTVS